MSEAVVAHCVRIDRETGSLLVSPAGMYEKTAVHVHPDSTFITELYMNRVAYLSSQWYHHFLTCRESIETLLKEEHKIHEAD